MNNLRLYINYKGELKESRDLKKRKQKVIKKYIAKYTGDARLDKYVDLINDENYMDKAIVGVADKLITKEVLSYCDIAAELNDEDYFDEDND